MAKRNLGDIMLTVNLDERFLLEQIDHAIYFAKHNVANLHDRVQITEPLYRVRGYIVASAELKEIDAIPMDTATRRKAEGKRS